VAGSTPTVNQHLPHVPQSRGSVDATVMSVDSCEAQNMMKNLQVEYVSLLKGTGLMPSMLDLEGCQSPILIIFRSDGEWVVLRTYQAAHSDPGCATLEYWTVNKER